jgi:hypothetical protein
MTDLLFDKKLAIGYGAYSTDFSVPGDRRRFSAYAQYKGFTYEFADPSKEYDIVYITYNSNLGKWIEYKKKRGNKCKLIFELIDSYLSEDFTWKSALKGVFNYVTGRNSKFYFDYRRGIIELCEIADAIVCSTEEQKKIFDKYNTNIHVSTDIFSGDITNVKEDFRISHKLKIVWEGQPYTLHNILEIKSVLNELSDEIELHIVTDPFYNMFSNKYIKRRTANLINEIKCKKTFYKWEKETFSKIISSCDLSIIPIVMSNKMSFGKPENKLILLWQMGIPTLTSATPAYERVNKNAGLTQMICYNQLDWLNKIQKFKSISITERKELSDRAKKNVAELYCPELLYKKWDAIFLSI